MTIYSVQSKLPLCLVKPNSSLFSKKISFIMTLYKKKYFKFYFSDRFKIQIAIVNMQNSWVNKTLISGGLLIDFIGILLEIKPNEIQYLLKVISFELSKNLD